MYICVEQQQQVMIYSRVYGTNIAIYIAPTAVSGYMIRIYDSEANSVAGFYLRPYPCFANLAGHFFRMWKKKGVSGNAQVQLRPLAPCTSCCFLPATWVRCGIRAERTRGLSPHLTTQRIGFVPRSHISHYFPLPSQNSNETLFESYVHDTPF